VENSLTPLTATFVVSRDFFLKGCEIGMVLLVYSAAKSYY